jgi:hypothetical protein
MPGWPEALEALARYMVILLTHRLHAVPGDYVKSALILRTIQDLYPLPRHASYPFRALETGSAARANLLIVFFSRFNLLLRGLVCVCCTT